MEFIEHLQGHTNLLGIFTQSRLALQLMIATEHVSMFYVCTCCKPASTDQILHGFHRFSIKCDYSMNNKITHLSALSICYIVCVCDLR